MAIIKGAAWWREYRRKKKTEALGLRELGFGTAATAAKQEQQSANADLDNVSSLSIAQPAILWEYKASTLDHRPEWVQPRLRLVSNDEVPQPTKMQPPVNVQPQLSAVLSESSCAAATMVAQLLPPKKHPLRLAQLWLRNPTKAILGASILLFVLCNTAYLAFGQQAGYVSLGYAAPIAWGIAVLCEVAMEILSFSIAVSESWIWKAIMAGTLIASIWVMAGLVSQSAEDKALQRLQKPLSLISAEDKVKALSGQLSAATEAISNLDSVSQRSRRIYAAAEMSKKGGLSEQLSQAQVALSQEEASFRQSSDYQRGVDVAENQALARKLALAWNIIMVQFLGFLMKRQETR